jgi:[CysO sulfur-carrier protein]-S-L-cysteine hydrolase
VRIGRTLLDELIAHAREEAPNECCGVIAVELDPPLTPAEPHPDALSAAVPRAARVHRAVNMAASPLKFEVDGKELLGLIDAIERDGRGLGAIYHSHTRTAPRPSQTDINFAGGWPGVEWIIVGLAEGEAPEVRSYLIEDGVVREALLEVE